MSLSSLLETLTQRGIRLYLEEEKLRFVAPPNAMDAQIRFELKKYKPDLLELLNNVDSIHQENTSSSTVSLNESQQLTTDASFSGLSPASLSQKSLWFLDKMGVPPETYALHMSWSITGPLDTQLLERSVEKLIDRHPAFRTAFVEINEELMQDIRPCSNFKLSTINVSPGESWRSLATQLIEQPFDLSAGHLFRGEVYRYTDTQFIVCFVTHHIVMDGWSVAIFTRELEQLYRALIDSKTVLLDKINYQYANFADEQSVQLKEKKFEHALTYWKKALANSSTVLPLPFDYSRPVQPSYYGGSVVRKLSVEVMERVNFISRELGATPYIVFLSIFKAFLYRYSSESDVLVGTPVANRNDSRSQNSIGFFMNTIVMRSKIQPNWRLQDLIHSVKNSRYEGMAHEGCPFELLVQELEPERSLNIHPIFQTLFVFQNATGNPLSLPNMSVQPIEHIGRQVAKFDLALEIRPSHAGGYEYNLNYSLDLFDASSMVRMSDCLDEFMIDAIADLDKSIDNLYMLPEKQLEELNKLSHGDEIPLENLVTIHEKFQQQCVATPNNQAFSYQDKKYSFKDLAEYVSDIKSCLIRADCVAGDIVGVSLERSPEYVATIIAIMECGAVWLPLDTEYPLATLRYMFEDSEAVLLVHNPKSELARQIAKPNGSQIRSRMILSKTDSVVRQTADSERKKRVSDGVAYLVYTSGSSGTPKGVLGTHLGALNRFSWMWREYPFVKSDVSCIKTPISFVDSIWETFGALLQGVPSVIIQNELSANPEELLKKLNEHSVTRLLAVPSLLSLMMDQLKITPKLKPNLSVCISSGEKLSPELASRINELFTDIKLLNLYGSSEVSADACCHRVVSFEGNERLPVGLPIDNTQVFVLDKYLQQTPIGVKGEVYVGGLGVAVGYHGANIQNW